jgi:hypothetical protein
MKESCDVDGCPHPEQHFPVAQLVLPMAVPLAIDLMRGVSEACERQGLKAVFLDLPDHGNGRLYAGLP